MKKMTMIAATLLLAVCVQAGSIDWLVSGIGAIKNQAGSNITNERVRFDFTYDEKLIDEKLKKIEEIVNEKIKENLRVSFEIMPLKKAKAVYHTVKIAQVYSLNRTYDQDEKLTLEDIMTDENKLGGDVDPFLDMLRDYCEAAGLTDMETKVLAIRHGMLDLIRVRKVKKEEPIAECLAQKLARLGYNYKVG